MNRATETAAVVRELTVTDDGIRSFLLSGKPKEMLVPVPRSMLKAKMPGVDQFIGADTKSNYLRVYDSTTGSVDWVLVTVREEMGSEEGA